MTRSQALKEAVHRWGKLGCVEDRGAKRASNEEQRNAARAERKALLDSLTPEEKKARREELDRLFSAAFRYRYTVGEIGGFPGFRCFHIRGQGDSWEDAFSKADK